MAAADRLSIYGESGRFTAGDEPWVHPALAAPAGAVIWLISNINISGDSLANHAIYAFNDFGWLLGLNGVILLAYIVAIPANEIVIPTILMLTVANLGMLDSGAGEGVMFELDSDMAKS